MGFTSFARSRASLYICYGVRLLESADAEARVASATSALLPFVSTERLGAISVSAHLSRNWQKPGQIGRVPSFAEYNMLCSITRHTAPNLAASSPLLTSHRPHCFTTRSSDMSSKEASTKLSCTLTPYTASNKPKISRGIHCEGRLTGPTRPELDLREVLCAASSYLTACISRHSAEQYYDLEEDRALWGKAVQYLGISAEISWTHSEIFNDNSVECKVKEPKRGILEASKLTIDDSTGKFEFTISTGGTEPSVLPDKSQLRREKSSPLKEDWMEPTEDLPAYRQRLRDLGLADTLVEGATSATTLMKALARNKTAEEFRARLKQLRDKSEQFETLLGPLEIASAWGL